MRSSKDEEIAYGATAPRGTELIGGALLLSNRYVPLALTLLGPVIVNVPSNQMFLDSKNMTPPMVVTMLWFVVFSQARSSFAGLLAKKAGVKSSNRDEALGLAGPGWALLRHYPCLRTNSLARRSNVLSIPKPEVRY